MNLIFELFVSSYNNPAINFKTPYRQLHWSYLWFLNIWLLLSPSQLCAEYAMDTIPPISSLTDPRNLLTLATLAGLISMVYYDMIGREPHRRKVLFSLCLMVVPFLPASNLFFPVGFVIAERVLYIPSMGFCMLVAYGAWRMIKYTKWTSLTIKFLFLLFIMFSMKTLHRNRDWKNNYTLFESAIRTTPNNAKMLNFHATAHLLPDGEFFLAGKLYHHLLDVEPRYVRGYRALGAFLKRLEIYNESIEVRSSVSVHQN